MHGKNDHADGGEPLAHECGRLESGNALHGDIHEDDVRLLARGELERFLAARRLSDHRDVGHGVEERADTCADERVVVGKEHADRHAAASFLARESGNIATSKVPCPGAERNSSEPEASAMRSSMLTSPRLAPLAARLRTASRSKPAPSSRTESASRFPAP